jgi:hypothetical protein
LLPPLPAEKLLKTEVEKYGLDVLFPNSRPWMRTGSKGQYDLGGKKWHSNLAI